ncbi:MAG TPA: SDR family NAD(P)-dependent oxidoreductase [Gaiellales bacterium]|jgi:NAD(P)-dependent dehydrogenase (short-subunit alcohol dehydrogenase family)|nr:SDR family NAD(P)-dependent oxidoreductase [Gaiellales bacterium]
MSTITTRYGRETKAAEVVEGIDLTGRRIIVTGASSGIGVETARALASTGADVTLAVRDLAAGERTAGEIAETTGNSDVHVAHLDLADRASVAAFVAAWDGPLHALVNNAGVMASPETRTPEGWELQFATNHLGHFALALGLHDALSADGAGRIVAVSSAAHRRSPVVFDDINFERRAYDPWLAYGQSKTANVLFAVEAARRWAGDGITANALMPGGISTNLQRYVDPAVRAGWSKDMATGGIVLKTPEQGAATSVLLATSPELAGITGRYFEDCNEAVVVPDDSEASGGVRRYALDPEAAARLWDVSLEMLATPPPAA